MPAVRPRSRLCADCQHPYHYHSALRGHQECGWRSKEGVQCQCTKFDVGTSIPVAPFPSMLDYLSVSEQGREPTRGQGGPYREPSPAELSEEEKTDARYAALAQRARRICGCYDCCPGELNRKSCLAAAILISFRLRG